MTAWEITEQTTVLDVAAARDWAAIEEIYAAAVARIAAIAEEPAAAPLADVVQIAEVRHVGGLAIPRPRHASAETATFTRVAA